MAETILSYLLAEESSNPQVETKIFALKSSELLGKMWYFQPQNPSLRTHSATPSGELVREFGGVRVEKP